MPDENKKLAAFLAAVEESAQAQAGKISSVVHTREAEALRQYEAELLEREERRRALGSAEAKTRADKSVAAARQSARRALLAFREQCGDEVCDEVLGRLRDFPNTDKYDDSLSELLFEAIGMLPGDNVYTVYLRPEDMKYTELLSGAVPRAKLTFAEGSFTLGGLIVENQAKTRRADMTYDSAFRDVKSRFAELTGFRLEGNDG